MDAARVNIYDVAQEAEVSISTVSRVLRGAESVSPETRRRVQEVIDCVRAGRLESETVPWKLTLESSKLYDELT